MRRIFTYIAAALLAGAAFSACSVKETANDSLGSREIKFTASVGQFQTKADEAQVESIGLFVYGPYSSQLNKRLDIVEGAVIPSEPILWDAEQYVEQPSRFIAYFPYDPEREDLWADYFVKQDQSTLEAYKASDLLIADTESAPADGTVHLSFVHKFTQVTLTIDNHVNDEEIVEAYFNNVWIGARGSELEYGSMSGDLEQASVKMLPVLLENGSRAWSMIIPGQYMSNPSITVVTASGTRLSTSYDYQYVRGGASYVGTADLVLEQEIGNLDFGEEIADWNEGWDMEFPNQGQDPGWAVVSGTWSLIGDMDGWEKDHDLEVGDGFIRSITIELRKDQCFKFRQGGSWDYNDLGFDADWDGTTHYMQEGQMNLRLKGPDIYVPTSGLWYLQVNLEKLTLYAYLMEEYPDNPDPDPDPQTDVWGLIGSMTDWVGDIDMTAGADGATYDLTIELAKGDEFKFRKNADWDQGDLGANASNNTLTEGTMLLLAKGANIAVAQSGIWHLVLDPGTPSLEVELVEAYTDPDDPDPEQPTQPVWSVIGSMNGEEWGVDHVFELVTTDFGDVLYYIEIDLQEGDEFKFRKDYSWTVNFGYNGDDNPYVFPDSLIIWSDESTYDVPDISLALNGCNFCAPSSGTWSIELYPDEYACIMYRQQD